MKKSTLLAGVLVVAAAAAAFYYFFLYGGSSPRSMRVMQWIRNPESHPDWAITAGDRCGDAPFMLPTNGFIGYLWNDSFRPGHHHTGLDIFGGTDVGITPVVAAYDGYLTRLGDWKSTVDHPHSRRIPQARPPDWTYYTHMGGFGRQHRDRLGLPGRTVEKFVKAGTLLAGQGNYSGTSVNPDGGTAFFQSWRDDGQGKFPE